MATSNFTYSQYLYSIKNPDALQAMINLENAVNTGQISQAEFATTVEQLTGKTVQPVYSRYGSILGYNMVETPTVVNANPINSNTSTVSRAITARPVSSTVNTSGKAVIEGLKGVGSKALTGAALVGTAAMCVSAGITLGKTIDSALYNLNPDFWNSNNMGSLNPETWKAITAGDDSFGASLLNVLFGFDDEGNAQAYMDENAFAYMAAYLNNAGAFTNVTTSEISEELYTPLSYSLYFNRVNYVTKHLEYSTVSSNSVYTTITEYTAYTNNNSSYIVPYLKINSSGNISGMIIPLVSLLPNAEFIIHRVITRYKNSTGESEILQDDTWTSTPSYTQTINGVVIYHGTWIENTYETPVTQSMPFNTELRPWPTYSTSERQVMAELGYCVLYGEIEPGIGNQENSLQPDVTNWSDYNNVLPSLQQQYPELWNNAINYPVIQPDGSVTNYKYIPVTLPDNFTRTGNQPTSGNASQTAPSISPDYQTIIDELTKILTQPYPKTDTEADTSNQQPPQNPVDTGEGSSPSPIVPVGSASSLWKIYHPTQEQVNSFGGWLWSSEFIDQILKIFNDPMQAIIGLHKVYATPIDAGSATIKVGYLDSGVPSAYIDEQYITVDCGTINLNEQFGNVFDYSPFTEIHLYLPFVGIVPLNVNDVMRSSINVKYGVDVLTGACLASVSVYRDGNTAILYQYSGNCAVQYPISSGSYMGIVSSIISIAGGIATTVATGGSAAPVALGVAGAAMNAHTNVQHSGSFSGNAGAMGGKIPYLIISRPQTKVNSNFEEMEGYPTNYYVTVGECSGYIKAKSVHIINVNATDDELNQLNELLVNGIII